MFEIVFFMDHRGQFLLYKEDWFSCSPSCSQFRNIYCEIRDIAKLGTFAILFMFLLCSPKPCIFNQ
ncbi:hypothetical protein C0J52_18621 [Blattella germanica]|nr:hypothetical protein C0J52_18621 [Blattella germanica]